MGSSPKARDERDRGSLHLSARWRPCADERTRSRGRAASRSVHSVSSGISRAPACKKHLLAVQPRMIGAADHSKSEISLVTQKRAVFLVKRARCACFGSPKKISYVNIFF